MQTQTGIVKKWLTEKGFGFIEPDSQPGSELFVHWQALEMDGYRELRAGDRVQFSVGENSRGECAVHVRLLEPEPAAAGGDGAIARADR